MRTALLVFLPLLTLASSAAPAQAPPVVEVRLSNFNFTPRTIVFDHGQPYVLRLINEASGGHNFAARGFFDAASVAPRDRGWVQEGEVEVSARQVREIRLTAPAPGKYKLKCTHTLHSTFGMKGTIVVR